MSIIICALRGTLWTLIFKIFALKQPHVTAAIYSTVCQTLHFQQKNKIKKSHIVIPDWSNSAIRLLTLFFRDFVFSATNL